METFERLYDFYLPEPLKGTGKNKVSDCPFCEAEGKFSVDVTTGKARCLHAACDVHVNHITFITKYHQAWLEFTTDEHYASLKESRGISVATLKMAGLAYDAYKHVWLVPYANPFTPNLCNLGAFHTKGKNAYRVFKGPNVNGEMPLPLYNPFQDLKQNDECYLVEGEWDTLAMLDAIASDTDGAHPAVLGKPGAIIFPEQCRKWFEHIDHVYCVDDNDEAGELGKAKSVNTLSSWQIDYLVTEWTEIEEAETDWDIRDLLINLGPTDAYAAIYNALVEADPSELNEPEEELSAGYIASVADISEIPKFDTYLRNYEKHMHLTDINRQAIALTMSIASCQYMHGEPLWFFLVGQAGCGKTTLIESFGGCNEYFDYASRITSKSLVSGWNSGADASLLPKMNGKSFFIKDFTVVLGLPKEQRREVFNLFRDIYDGTLKITFGNGKVCYFPNLKFNIIAGVTDIIKQHNDASMGERFLRLDYMGDSADDIKIIQSALGGFGQSTTRKQELTEASVGYIKTLAREENRWNLGNLPRLCQTSIDRLTALARYTAHIRTRPEHDKNDGLLYRPRPEVASRLALQYAKLSYALEKTFNPLLLNTPSSKRNGVPTLSLTDRTLNHVAKVAHDTADGFNQEVIKLLFEHPKRGRKDLESLLGVGQTRVHRTMDDLKTLGLVHVTKKAGDRSRNRDPKGRPSEYYSVNHDFLPIVEKVFPDLELGAQPDRPASHYARKVTKTRRKSMS